MNSVLSGLAQSPDCESHSRMKSNLVWTRSKDILWVGLQLKMVLSSMNMFRPCLDQVEFISLSRGDMKRADKMGERGEPCGMP